MRKKIDSTEQPEPFTTVRETGNTAKHGMEALAYLTAMGGVGAVKTIGVTTRAALLGALRGAKM